ncbi:MAG TPA: hypothetical protein VFR01_06360 [Geobacterales bacterium]|jgi:uncharacterized Zn finger protein|nr:hypothetical protein [Geobacterales bacterium]
MKCPACGSRKGVEIDIHSEGFSAEESPVKECNDCGLVWRVKTSGDKPVIDIIKPASKKK